MVIGAGLLVLLLAVWANYRPWFTPHHRPEVFDRDPSHEPSSVYRSPAPKTDRAVLVEEAITKHADFNAMMAEERQVLDLLEAKGREMSREKPWVVKPGIKLGEVIFQTGCSRCQATYRYRSMHLTGTQGLERVQCPQCAHSQYHDMQSLRVTE